MKIGLFIPCYINNFYPQVAIATLKLLEGFDLEVEYPQKQTCCGQPLGNSGFDSFTHDIARQFVNHFSNPVSFDYIVSPSGSCVYHVQKHYDILQQSKEVQHVRKNIIELSDFLIQILKVKSINASFPYKVGIHQSCHGLRGLRIGKSTEMVGDDYSSLKELLQLVRGLEIIELERKDECCGFGGTFAVTEEAVSVKMGNDRLQDHLLNKTKVITATDMSCLMHLEGLIKRQKLALKVMHFSEILNCKE